MSEKLSQENIDSTIAKGALVNVLGILGKLAHPLLFVVITRLYGPDIAGAYILVAGAIVTVVLNLAVSGINDGIQLFAARALEDTDKDRGDSALYRVIANGFVVSISICVAVLLFAQLGSSLLAPMFSEQVLESIRRVSWALPFLAIPVVVVSSTKALLMMKWEAILQSSFAPLSLLGFAVLFYFISPTLNSLLFAFLVRSVLVAIVSLVVFSRYFSYKKLFHSLRHFHFHRALLGFALPQNLNRTFNTFITQLDVLMLGYFRVANEIIAFYAIAAQIVFNIRQIKLAFSGIYSPIISRLQERGDYDQINASFSMISRWIMTIALPATLLVAIFRDQLIALFHSSFAGQDSDFMLVLLVPPLLACTLGLAANVLVMTGHSMWNLTNSILIASINAGLNYVLIPEYGLMGAAMATAIAATLVTTLQVVETYFLEKTHLMLSRVYKPILAITPGVAMVAYLTTQSPSSSTMRLWAAALSLVFYVAILALLRFEDEDRKILGRKLKP